MTNKSQLIEQRYSDTYHDLVNFIKWQAKKFSLPNHWMLNRDDLVAEGFLVLTKLVPKYIDKPYDEFLVLARVSIGNWYRTLYNQLNAQKRKDDWDVQSIEYTVGDEADEEYETQDIRELTALSQSANYLNLNPDAIVVAATEFSERVAQLSEFDQQVLGCMNGDNPRVMLYLELARSRRTFNYAEPMITVTPLIISRALCVDECEVTSSLSRIQSVFRK